MGLFGRIPVGITFSAGNSSPRKDSTAWYQRRGIKVSAPILYVTNLLGDLKVAVVRVNAVGILPTMDMFGCQVLFIEIKWSGFGSEFLLDGLVKSESESFVNIATTFVVVEVS